MSYAHELGERRIIKLILNAFERMPGMVLPFGDDVSAVDLGGGRLAVLKADMLVKKTDVPPGMSLWQAARKAVVMGVSDLAAKGVQPQVVLVSLGLPSDFRVREIEQVGMGLNAGAREYGAYVIGGDTSEASDMVISCLLFGIGEKKKLMKRSGAKPGDIVAVTGFFGKPSAGLKILKEAMEVPPRLRDGMVKSVYMPKARLKEGLALAKTGAVTSSIDSSDGLAWSLHELSEMSNVGFALRTVPVAPEVRRFAELHDLDADSLALYGGEEYELVVTINPRRWDEARRTVREVGGNLIRIGQVTEKPTLTLRIKGRELTIEPRGYEHFKRI